jgi:hypothetical protein
MPGEVKSSVSNVNPPDTEKYSCTKPRDAQSVRHAAVENVNHFQVTANTATSENKSTPIALRPRCAREFSRSAILKFDSTVRFAIRKNSSSTIKFNSLCLISSIALIGFNKVYAGIGGFA